MVKMSDELVKGRYSRRSFLSRAGLVAGAAGATWAGLDYRPAKAAAASNTLTIALNGTSQTAASLKQTIGAAFEKAHPGVTVNFIPIQGTDWTDYFAKVLTLIASGTPIDATNIATEGLQLFADKGLAEPLDSYVRRDKAELKGYFADVHPLLVESAMYQGSLFILPTDFNCGNMYYDTALFEKHGIGRPDPNWTLTDFEAIARKIGKANSNAVAWDWVVRLWGSWTSWMYANDANLLSEGRWSGGGWMWDTFYKNNPSAKGRKGGWHWGAPTANDPKVVEALQLMIDLKKRGYASSPDVGGGTTLQGLFASNHIGMTIGGGFWAGGLHNAGMKTNQFDVQFFPKWATQKHLLGDAGYAMFKKSANKDLTFEFLKSLTKPAAIGSLVNGNVSTPTRRSMLTASRYGTTGPKHWQVFYDTLDKFPNTTPIPAPPYYQAMANAFITRTTQAMAGGQAKKALDALQSDLEKLHKGH